MNATAVENEALVPMAATPVELLRIAVSQNADIDKLTKLVDLQERWERNEARKAFVVAMNAFKANPPAILKNKHVSFGTTNYSHATLDAVCDAVTKALSEHGISYRWRPEQPSADSIRVTCILTHEKGYAEETTLEAAPDQSGSKNSIQAVGATVTYLERYTLLAATGLAAANTDTDGRPVVAGLSADRIREQCEWITNAKDVAELKLLFKNAYVEADAAKDRTAMAAYIKAKDARKRDIQ